MSGVKRRSLILLLVAVIVLVLVIVAVIFSLVQKQDATGYYQMSGSNTEVQVRPIELLHNGKECLLRGGLVTSAQVVAPQTACLLRLCVEQGEQPPLVLYEASGSYGQGIRLADTVIAAPAVDLTQAKLYCELTLGTAAPCKVYLKSHKVDLSFLN